jgi:chromosome segregation ATPase
MTAPAEASQTLERGFVASLRWLVAEGDVRGVRRIAVELRALREALTTLDETRTARDEYAQRAAELDREIQSALAMLGPATAINGNGSLVQRLMRLREKLAEDTAAREQLARERDAWRAMCTLLTHTRASVQEQLDVTERERHQVGAQVEALRHRVFELTAMHDDAAHAAATARQELDGLREQLKRWSGTVERALQELAREARTIGE